jgi:hypothetical protein
MIKTNCRKHQNPIPKNKSVFFFMVIFRLGQFLYNIACQINTGGNSGNDKIARGTKITGPLPPLAIDGKGTEDDGWVVVPLPMYNHYMLKIFSFI